MKEENNYLGKTGIRIKIIAIGLKKQMEIDTLEARMVHVRLKDLEAEFENNDIRTEIWIR